MIQNLHQFIGRERAIFAFRQTPEARERTNASSEEGTLTSRLLSFAKAPGAGAQSTSTGRHLLAGHRGVDPPRTNHRGIRDPHPGWRPDVVVPSTSTRARLRKTPIPEPLVNQRPRPPCPMAGRPEHRGLERDHPAGGGGAPGTGSRPGRHVQDRRHRHRGGNAAGKCRNARVLSSPSSPTRDVGKGFRAWPVDGVGRFGAAIETATPQIYSEAGEDTSVKLFSFPARTERRPRRPERSHRPLGDMKPAGRSASWWWRMTTPSGPMSSRSLSGLGPTGRPRCGLRPPRRWR